MKIPMGENEKSKYDSVFEEKKSAFKRTETAKSEEKEIIFDEKDNKKGEKSVAATAGPVGKMFVKGDEKGSLKSKQKLRMTTLRRSLSEVIFCAFLILFIILYIGSYMSILMTVLLNLSRAMRKRFFSYAKIKMQVSFAVTEKLISTFVFATRIVQSLCFLNPNYISKISVKYHCNITEISLKFQ